MTEELKPCPFCGCEVKICIGIHGLDGIPKRYAIYHPENDCMIECFTSYFTGDKNKLIEDWNKRAQE